MPQKNSSLEGSQNVSCYRQEFLGFGRFTNVRFIFALKEPDENREHSSLKTISFVLV